MQKNIFKLLFILLFINPNYSFGSDKDPTSFAVAKIMHKRQSNVGWEEWVTVKVLSHIPLKWWANCNYYDKDWELIASTRHILKERVPGWKVKADYKDIENVMCSGENLYG